MAGSGTKKMACNVCGNLVGGVPGADFQIVVNGRMKYYCNKCLKDIWGWGNVQGKDTKKK